MENEMNIFIKVNSTSDLFFKFNFRSFQISTNLETVTVRKYLKLGKTSTYLNLH